MAYEQTIALLMLLWLAFTIRMSGQTPTTYTFYCPEVSLIPTVQSELPNTLPGVVIESWRYDPADKIVILHLVNNSGKDVTGFNISIAEKYADGSTNYVDGRPNDIHDHQMMEDFLSAMINFQSGMRRSGMVVAGPARGAKDGAMQEIMRQDGWRILVSFKGAAVAFGCFSFPFWEFALRRPARAGGRDVTFGCRTLHGFCEGCGFLRNYFLGASKMVGTSPVRWSTI